VDRYLARISSMTVKIVSGLRFRHDSIILHNL
jgi:hypothetical protein